MKNKKQEFITLKCKTCKHWKNHQMLLNYDEHTGFCVNTYLKFNTTTGRLIGVVDTLNLRDRTKVSGNPANDFESADIQKVYPSQYLLQTEEDFGCIYHSGL